MKNDNVVKYNSFKKSKPVKESTQIEDFLFLLEDLGVDYGDFLFLFDTYATLSEAEKIQVFDKFVEFVSMPEDISW